MAYSELIKNFNKIRDYMRDFYVYGFKSRDDYTKKSTRSYDDEKRRIESWLGNYMKFHQTADGKNVFLSIDSRATRHNPLYKAWKTKSFTDGDITLHFIVMDILSNGQELSLGDVAYQVDEYLAGFEHARVFDISTIRKKLNEYVKEGLLVRRKSGKTMLYSRTEEFEMPSRDVLDFFSETAPCGVIGSFLEDKTNNIADHFVFKHHYITSAMDSEALYMILKAIHEKRNITVEMINRKKDRITETNVVPLRVMISVQSGRQYMMAYTPYFKRITAYRLTTAICYAKVIEDEAIEQIRRMCDYDLTRGSKVRIMPDVHAGKGCTIGTTMTITDKICPNIVGVDIGCGMYTVKLQDQVIDFEKIDEACHYIPSGMNVWEGRMERFDLTQLKCYRSLKDAKRLERSLGTLGGGNHFIEVDRAKDGTYYLVIHSGSRNLGKQVAEIYQQLAIDLHAGKEEYFKKRDEIIRTYKEQGRRAEIQEALKHLKKNYEIQELDAPNDICWLYGSFMDDYLHDVEICQRFARRSRERMAEIIIERTKMTRTEAFHTIHNYIDVNEMILRKGAIAAHSGEKVLIPINMRDGSVLAVGKGNAEWNNSAPHGAGRIMSRTKAKQSIDLEEYKASMQGIYSTSVNADTLDEAPMAYKSLADIIDVIRDSVEIIDIMKPVYNFKASDSEVPWKKRGDTNERKDTGAAS